jgi:hypothetical protein
MKYVHNEGLTKDEYDDMIVNEVADIIFKNASYSYDVTYSKSAGELDSIHISIDLYKVKE